MQGNDNISVLEYPDGTSLTTVSHMILDNDQLWCTPNTGVLKHIFLGRQSTLYYYL